MKHKQLGFKNLKASCILERRFSFSELLWRKSYSFKVLLFPEETLKLNL